MNNLFTATLNEKFKSNLSLYNKNSLDRNVLNENSIDLVITSPPYNVGINYNSNEDTLSYEKYLEFTDKWISNCYYWAKPTARICLNIPLDKNKDGQQSIYADITKIAKDIGWKYHSTVVWNEQNISRRTAWGSWLSASAPYVIAPVEMILLMYKDVWKKNYKGDSDITRDEFIEWTNGVWTFNGESKKRIGHPAPFPRELPKRCIKLFSYIGDTILDPFAGSGTTLIEALINNRKAIGIKLDIDYYKLANERILNVLGE